MELTSCLAFNCTALHHEPSRPANEKNSRQALQVQSPVLREARRVLGEKAASEKAAKAAKTAGKRPLGTLTWPVGVDLTWI